MDPAARSPDEGKTAAAGGELFLTAIQDALHQEPPPAINAGVDVVAGQLGAKAEVLGAIVLAGRKVPAGLPSSRRTGRAYAG